MIRAKGCPGGGKTYWIFERLAEHIEDGSSYDDVYVFTFTNAGRAEVEDRLVELFDADDMSAENRRRVKRRAKTVHGAACSAAYAAGVIDDVGEQVIAPSGDADVYRRFCNQHGLTYARRERDPLKIARNGQNSVDTQRLSHGSPPSVEWYSPDVVAAKVPSPRQMLLFR